jgi:chlorite dismutase
MSEAKIDPAVVRPLDLSEKGRKGKDVISLDRRLFMKFSAFTDVDNPTAVCAAIEKSGLVAAVYADANDPYGIGVMVASEDPSAFVTTLRAVFNSQPFVHYTYKPEFDMLGRSYSSGYEPDLEFTLITRPQQNMLDPRNEWAVWYPLQRAKNFYVLPEDRQKSILGEHGTLAKRYGAGGHATDVRLACHGLDRDDNDFVIGLLGPNLHPLSAVVQEMRRTEQTSQYLDRLGPFFIGKAIWQSPMPASNASESGA